MDKGRRLISGGLWLDARRALWMEEWRTLVVADLHLGYAWAHRHSGQMLPVTAEDDSVPRLHALIDDYTPGTLVLLGDIVHRAIAVPAIKEQLCCVVSEIEKRTELKLIAGNHDRALGPLLRECHLDAELHREISIGPHLLLHGHAVTPELVARPRKTAPADGRLIIGHEHPAITIGDRVLTSVKVPCFALAPEILILPAFSHWAAGTNIRTHLPAFTQRTGVILQECVAILAGKLLPVRL